MRVKEWKWVTATVTCWRTDASDRNSRRMTLAVAFATRRDVTSRDVPWRYHQPRSQRGSPQAGRFGFPSAVALKACEARLVKECMGVRCRGQDAQGKPILNFTPFHHQSFANREFSLCLSPSPSFAHTHTCCCYTIKNCSRGPKVCITLPLLSTPYLPLQFERWRARFRGFWGHSCPSIRCWFLHRKLKIEEFFSFFFLGLMCFGGLWNLVLSKFIRRIDSSVCIIIRHREERWGWLTSYTWSIHSVCISSLPCILLHHQQLLTWT